MKWLLLTIVIFLGSCTTFSKNQCSQMNWYQQGNNAALNGQYSEQTFGYYQEKCGTEHGVVPDKAHFLKGYNDGVSTFCTPANGLRYGRGGGTYNGTCPPELEAGFLPKYQLGRIEYTGNRLEQLEKEVIELKRDNAYKDSQIRDLESQIPH